MVETLGHVRGLDGIRGVAIMLVVGMHYFGFPSNGDIGVDLFFVLSGFLITTLLLEERAQTGRVSFSRFYVRRARRLLPALAVVLAVFLLVDAARGRDGLGTVALYGLYGGNVYQAFWHAHSDPLVGLNHLWSLAEEEQFYLVWPLALVLLVRVRRAAAWLLVIAAALIVYRAVLVFGFHAPAARITLAPDTHSEGLVLGSAFAFYRAVGGRVALRGRLLALGLFGGGMLLFMSPSPTFDALWRPVFEASAVLLVGAALTENPVSRALQARPFVWLGGISYSLYLWHPVVRWALHGEHGLGALSLSIAAAYVSTRWVEQPFRWRMRFALGRRSVPRAQHAVT